MEELELVDLLDVYLKKRAELDTEPYQLIVDGVVIGKDSQRNPIASKHLDNQDILLHTVVPQFYPVGKNGETGGRVYAVLLEGMIAVPEYGSGRTRILVPVDIIVDYANMRVSLWPFGDADVGVEHDSDDAKEIGADGEEYISEQELIANTELNEDVQDIETIAAQLRDELTSLREKDEEEYRELADYERTLAKVLEAIHKLMAKPYRTQKGATQAAEKVQEYIDDGILASCTGQEIYLRGPGVRSASPNLTYNTELTKFTVDNFQFPKTGNTTSELTGLFSGDYIVNIAYDDEGFWVIGLLGVENADASKVMAQDSETLLPSMMMDYRKFGVLNLAVTLDEFRLTSLEALRKQRMAVRQIAKLQLHMLIDEPTLEAVCAEANEARRNEEAQLEVASLPVIKHLARLAKQTPQHNETIVEGLKKMIGTERYVNLKGPYWTHDGTLYDDDTMGQLVDIVPRHKWSPSFEPYLIVVERSTQEVRYVTLASVEEMYL